jgi:hypothetical protein
MSRDLAPFRKFAHFAALAALALASLATFTCERADSPRLVQAQPVRTVPGDVVFYSHVYYGGEDAYLVEGKWYRPGVDGWVIFTSEPLELELVRKSLRPNSTSLLGE